MSLKTFKAFAWKYIWATTLTFPCHLMSPVTST